jgi:tape measure domain-containing protein
MSSARAIEAGKAIVRVSLDRAAVDRGLREMEAKFRATSAILGGIGKQLIGAGAAMGLFAAAPLKFAANLQQTSVAFESIIGDAGRAETAMKSILDLAASTPFQFAELASAGQKLLAFGTGADMVSEELRRIGDISSAIGAPIGEVAEIYGKARVQGRLFAEDINQLTGRGIPVIGQLAKQFGVADSAVKELVKDGKVNFSDLEQAFISLTSEGGFAFGMMEKQSKTFLGKLSTLVDDVSMAMLPIGTELMAVIGPAMDAISEMIGAFAGTLATTEGLAASWLTAAAAAVGVGAALYATAKAIAAFNVVMTVARATTAAFGIAYTMVRTAVVASLAAWVAIQLAIHAAVAAMVIAGIAVRTFGIQVVVTRTAMIAWAIAAGTARAAILLMTNGVALAKVALGTYLIATNAAAIASNLLAGRLIASFIAARSLAFGSGLIASAFGVQSIATAGLAAVQGIATGAFGILTGALGLTTAASATATGAAGVLATAWTVASGVIASAYAVITSPLIPLYAATVAVVAGIALLVGIAAAATVSSGLLGDAWNYIVSSASGVIAVVKEVAAGLKEALAAGQYTIAAKMLWAGLKQIFWMGVKEVVRLFFELPGQIMGMMQRFGKTFIDTLWNLFTSIPSLLRKALSGEGIGDEIAAMFNGGDWLEGIASDGILNAKKELRELRGQVAKPVDEEQTNAAKTRIGELTDQIRELALGADAAEDAKIAEQLRKDGKSEADIAIDLAAIKALRDRKRALEEEKEASEKSAQAIIDNMTAMADAAEEAKQAGKQLTEDLRTPLEKFQDEIKRIEGMEKAGTINAVTASRAAIKAGAEYSSATRGAPAPELGSARYGSKAALDTIARTRAIGSDGASQTPPWVAPMTQAARAQLQATAQLPTNMAAAIQSATQKAIDTKKLEELAQSQLSESQRHATILNRIASNTATSAGLESL